MKMAREIVITKEDGEILASINLEKNEVIQRKDINVSFNYGEEHEYIDENDKLYVKEK